MAVRLHALFCLGFLGTALLQSCVGTTRRNPEPLGPAVEVTVRQRELVSSGHYLYIRSNRRSERITAQTLADFFQENPGLAQDIPASDLAFLRRLATYPWAAKLLEESRRAGERLQVRLAALRPVFSDDDRRWGRTDNLAQLDGLSPVDRLKVLLLLEALAAEPLVNRLAEILRVDLERMDAEYGGFVLLTGERDAPLDFIPVPSRIHDDYEYRPPGGLYALADFALWHNHASGEAGADLEELDNSSRAGPSGVLGSSLCSIAGDLWICYLQAVDGVVLTPTGGGTFNADFFSSEGTVLDLGTYSWSPPPAADGLPCEPGE